MTYKRVTVSFSVPYVYFTWVTTYNWGQIHLGHYAAHIGWYRVSYGFSIPIIHYVPSHKVYYTTYIKVPDYNNMPKVRCSYEWKGRYSYEWKVTTVVKKRIYSGGGNIILSLGGGTSSIYAIWEGLNEYAAHLDEFGSQGWIDPK